MNQVIEFLEQILDEKWTLARSVGLLNSLRCDAWIYLKGMLRDELIQLLTEKGDVLPEWRVEKILRDKKRDAEVYVRCTEKGARMV